MNRVYLCLFLGFLILGCKTPEDNQVASISYADQVIQIPNWLARSDQGAVAVVECVQRRFYGFQYHPEVLRMVYKMVTAPRVHEIRHHILWPKIPHSTATEYKWSSLSMNERIADSAYDGVVLCEIGW
ncbi:GMP synthase [Artemisia annua]|uniref:GMP synthase n=1 Tax=Artemisia annua TaxID=35608 RepID=A0A2U1KCF6_ARTAN|nr:GMP synthase [Artemisia annua]